MIVTCKRFSWLTQAELYAILRLRAEVFVVEQNCAYQDVDGQDQDAWHMLGFVDDDLAAYARILKPGTQHTEPAIGRVVTSPKYRGKKLGKEIFAASLNQIKTLFPEQNVRIMAQVYLVNFYADFGFKIASEEFLEDGIPHVEMICSPS